MRPESRPRAAVFGLAVLVPLALAAPLAQAAPLTRADGAAQAARPATAPLYTVTDLGTLTSGGTSVATAINNAGEVVGYGLSSTGVEHGFSWIRGTLADLGTEAGGGYSQANAVNDAGQVAGTADRTAGGYGYPVRWSASGVIQDLGGTVTNSLGVGNAIDPAGRVAGGQRPANSEGGPNAILYSQSGVPGYLGDPPDSLNAATGVNAVDQVVGSPAFVWQAGTVTMLPGLPGAGGAGASAINISGQVVGSVGDPAGAGAVEDAALWQHGVLTDLGTVNGIAYNQATAINAAGQVVGTADPECRPCTAPVAWLRQPGGTPTALSTLIPAGSGWTLQQANGINDRGQIVGAGLHNGALHAYLLTPVYSANVNFAVTGAPVPAGYAVDSGAAYGSRPGGLAYGWNIADPSNTRQRNSATSADARYDTLFQMQRTGGATSWRISVPDGTYLVHAVGGDPDYTDSVYRIDVNGTPLVSGTPSSSVHWFEGSAQVTVANGLLTLTNGSGSSNDKIDYIDVIES
jgi:probable HAF family extracellular repeat protein